MHNRLVFDCAGPDRMIKELFEIVYLPAFVSSWIEVLMQVDCTWKDKHKK